ncbi:cytochrome P450 [Aspergillus crustosus]
MAFTTALFIGAIVLAFFAVRNIHHQIQFRRNAEKLGCKPPPSAQTGFFGIPAFYRIIQATKQRRSIEHLSDRYDEYGTTFYQEMLGNITISTIDPENLKAILGTQFQDFSLGTRHRQFYPTLGDGIFTSDGAVWAHSRALLRPQFKRDQIADLDLMDGHITRLIELIPKDGSTFDIQGLFLLLTIDSATHFLFGESVGAMEEDTIQKKFSSNAQSFADAFNTALDYLAWRTIAQDLYWTINPKVFRDANRRVHEVVDYYVQKALVAQTSTEQNGDKKDGGRYIFAEALAADTQDPIVLRDNMLNILLAGRDTTASFLSSTMFLLARNQHIWKKLRDIIVEEFGDSNNPKDEITQARLKDIPYLRYVLNEVLRLLPPVPLNFRVATKDTTIPTGGGPDGKSPIAVKKGQEIFYSVYALHRRKDIYGEDADVFRPERWEDLRLVWEYLPFNGGPRICLGQQYALTEVSYTLVRLMQRFLTLENGEPEIIEPVKQWKLNLVHAGGVKVRLS